MLKSNLKVSDWNVGGEVFITSLKSNTSGKHSLVKHLKIFLTFLLLHNRPGMFNVDMLHEGRGYKKSMVNYF